MEVDISDTKVEVAVLRFEQDFFDSEGADASATHEMLHSKYGLFYERYVRDMINAGLTEDPAIVMNINSFKADPFVQEVIVETRKAYPEVVDFKKELEQALRYYRYHFPERKVPTIVTFATQCDYQIVVTDEHLGIGLDMYLGSDFKHYPALGLPQYRIRQMTPEHIVPDALTGWLVTEFPKDKEKQDLLSFIIYYGKIHYLLDATLRITPDHVKIGYTQEQLQWCWENEFNLWAHFIDQQLLYSKDVKQIQTYIAEGPFTSGLGNDSPSKLGQWLGWQIIRSYMKNNPKATLSQLMEINNPQRILDKSGYKPGK